MAEIGDKMPDGTVCAGISPDTNQPMYAAAVDAPLALTFKKAMKYAENLEVGGKKGFRLPSKAELDVLYRNREKGALKGTFNLTGSNPSGHYWSSTSVSRFAAWYQRFSLGYKDINFKQYNASVRCVRDC